MTQPTTQPSTHRRRRRRKPESSTDSQSKQSNPELVNVFTPLDIYDAMIVDDIHSAALKILETQGIKVLLPEALKLFREAGARVKDAEQMVYIGRDIVEAALASAPRKIEMKGGQRQRDVTLELGRLVFVPGAGSPYATDLLRGRRSGSIEDFRELVRLVQHFDYLHMAPPVVEAQDVPPEFRHYAMMEAALTLSDKIPFVYARGTPQTEDCFTMIQEFRGLSAAEFMANPWCFTVINTNSPRQLDIPMAQGLIDFARAGQLSIVTPFTLMGAMAPITVEGAMTLSHAEAMAAITLTQLAKSGAVVCYGTFTSNVDMRSGAPSFGTPEHVKASLLAGQLARKLGLPWRSATGSAANLNDVQAATETQFGLWGCLLSGATIVFHSAGWLEGGLTMSYEKLITDMEVVNMMADLCRKTSFGRDDLALDAIAKVEPGGHFFGCEHTMTRYKTAFYDPLIADLSNFGSWQENGASDTTTRANRLWQDILAQDSDVIIDEGRHEHLKAFIDKRKAESGAPPVS